MDRLVLLVEGREEATDPTALPAGVGHEVAQEPRVRAEQTGVYGTEIISGPLSTAWVLVDTAQ